MMENRAYEDEANKSAHHHHHHHHHPHQQLKQTHNHLQHSQLDEFSFDRVQMSDATHQQQMRQNQQLIQPRHTPDCHVYEDIVAPYSLSLDPSNPGGFHRNLTLPLRRTSQSCESIEGNPTSSSVRVTNKERTRGSVIDRLTRDDRYRDSGRDDSSSTERPARRRRKKDCRHCRTKAFERGIEEAKRRDELAVYEERSAELRAIFGLPDLSLCRLGPGCLSAGVVYAIGCNATDCSNGLVSGDGEPTTVPRFAHVQDGALDDKALITPPGTKGGGGGGGGGRAAGMKVNSIYAQEHWHAKDSRIFLNDPKDQNCDSPFQRAYSAVSANSPSSENRANLRRSVRDEPAPHPARLRKHRHGWTLHFSRPLSGAACTKSLVLLLVVVLALLGIGGIALYIVFEPEKLHVIQQYLRSSARNSTSIGENATEVEDSTWLASPPTPSLLDVLLKSNGPSLGDIEPIFEPPLTSATQTPITTSATTTSFSGGGGGGDGSRILNNSSNDVTSFFGLLSPHMHRRRPCVECRNDEVCVSKNVDEVPFCRSPLDPQDRSGCAGYCDAATQKCHRLENGASRCTEIEHHCLNDEWTCLNIFCIPLVKRCDGQMNCYDHSDEYNCECNLETHFHCGNQTSCLPLSKKCDGHVDCFDATDEENCTTSHDLGRLCPSKDEYTCRDKQQCIRRTRFCDKYRDCNDGSDEPDGCQGRCNKYEFTCHNGRCIQKAEKCNGIDDCGDGSDEQHCRERL
ncbi:PREDICTED: uncharacterized protein LOC105368347 [Ceratosolen solmsi marchali]|uniref:Uncharacterized protein LOC105368347 n=1 Tax=Ceratosolen solmsi marchali TaxID=326594 RepID=A0AAJ6YWC7_9HYME|nr:PREDICTED: uncharacterized protein LOC105368347 [Ceratosolen solmsi marchali]